MCLCQNNLIAAGFYDGVMLYSQALNETLSEQRTGPGPIQRPKGDLVTRRMWNRTFSGDPFLFHACLFWSWRSDRIALSVVNQSMYSIGQEQSGLKMCVFNQKTTDSRNIHLIFCFVLKYSCSLPEYYQQNKP